MLIESADEFRRHELCADFSEVKLATAPSKRLYFEHGQATSCATWLVPEATSSAQEWDRN